MRDSPRQRFILVLVFIACWPAFFAACASRGATSTGSADVLTAEQLAPYLHMNAFEAIRQTRPQWLRSERGRSSIMNSADNRRGLRVYLDGTLLGGTAELGSLEVRGIRQIRFLGAREATLRYGTNHAEGALLVTTGG